MSSSRERILATNRNNSSCPLASRTLGKEASPSRIGLWDENRTGTGPTLKGCFILYFQLSPEGDKLRFSSEGSLIELRTVNCLKQAYKPQITLNNLVILIYASPKLFQNSHHPLLRRQDGWGPQCHQSLSRVETQQLTWVQQSSSNTLPHGELFVGKGRPHCRLAVQPYQLRGLLQPRLGAG